MCRSDMLRAGLIGFPSSGKTALFQLLTSAREAPRAGGRQEAHVGVSRVPDERLDRLTALFKPKKHTPATVEFADMGGAAGTRTGAAALLDVAPFRNADALLHVVRHVQGPRRSARRRIDRPRAGRQDDGGRGHPGGPRRGRAAAGTTRARPQEVVGQRGPEEGTGDPGPLPRAARRRQAAPHAGSPEPRTRGACAGFSSSRRSRC